MQKEVSVDERCQSGIPGFDDICQGGFVRNSVNALLGGPGAGKTLFGLQFLHNGAAMYKEAGLYLSFEPDVYDIFKDAASMGWDFNTLEKEGMVNFMKISPMTDVEELKKDLMKVVSKYQIRRVCIDPIGLFGANIDNPGKERIVIFDLVSLLKRLGATVLLCGETASTDTEEVGMASAEAREQYVKFLADGLVDLYSSGLGGASDRAVRIAKMRRTSHFRGPVPLQISGKGLAVLSKKKGL
jgi:circadian clock protein KaiC